MRKQNAKPGLFPEPSARSERALSTFFVTSRSKLPMHQSPQEESVIRSDEVASSAPAKQPRPWTARWRGLTVGVASLAAVLGTALVPTLGATPAGATGPTVTVVTGHAGSTAPSLGVPAAAGSAKISPTYVAYNASNGDTAVASTQAGSVYVYLIAGGTGSESNEYMIQTAPNPSPAFGSLTSGDAYIVAGTGTAGLIAQPGNNQFGNSTTAVATANPIEPTSVAFDPNGNLLIAGEDTSSGDSAIQVVAKTTGTFYGVSMTAGDLYTVAVVGLSGSPSSAINMGDVAAPAFGMSVDPSGNIVVGNSDGVDFVNEQATGSLTLYGQSIPAQSSAVIAGTAEGGTDCAPGATSDSSSSLFFQNPAPFIDSSDNVYFSDNESGGPTGGGCDWVLPAQSGTLDGLSVTAGNVYKLAGNGGTTATTSGTAGVDSNVAGTSEMTLDSAGNVVLAVSGTAPGTSPALQVLAESTATYYGVAMTAGDLYTVAGGPSNLLATLSGPTSILNAGSGNLLFTDGAASSANLDEFSGAPTGASLVPTVTGVSPSSGPTAGGTSVTVTGTNLTGASAVDFGTANPGTSISAVTATSLTVTSPAGTGTVDVTVTTPNGTSAVNAPSDHFTYNAPALPTVTGVSPSSGPTAGGTSVTVTGTNLTGASAVDFGTANPGTSISAVTATSLTVTSPAGTGTVDVTVTTPNGTSAVNAPSDHFTYNAPALPTVTGVSPSSGPTAGGTSVTVTGTNLTGASAVDFGTANPGTSISAVTATSLTVTSPAGTGTVDVTVTTPNGTSAVNAPSDHFTYNAAPTVTNVSPNNGPQAGGNTVTVTGSGFVSGSTAVDFGPTAGTSVSVASGTSLTVSVPAGTGTVSVTVITTGGGSSTPLAGAYTYNPPPTVTGVSPSSGPTAGGTSVTVSGTNLTGASAVDFGTANPGTSISAVTATSLTVTSPAGTGTVDVTVTTPNGTSAVNAPSDHFTYNAPALPTVTGVSPSSGPTAGGTSVTVSGTNLTGASAVDFGTANPGTSISAVTATSLTVTSPAGTGTVDVTVTTPNGTSAVNAPSDHFTYNAPALPTVTGVSPSSGPTAGGTSVTVTGTNLTGASAVDFGTANPGTSISAVTATSLTVTSPAGTGTVDVTVTTPNGTSAVNAPSDHFTYNAPALPTVTGVSPSSGPTAGGTSVTVTGTNLTGASAVDFGTANPGTSISAVTATSLTVTSPAGTGTVDVTVTTPNGTSAINAPSDHFTYNAPALPTVTGVSPSSGPTAGGTSVTVSGTNLTGASAVDFGTANPGTSISAVTATSLTVTSPAGTGTVDVTVTTPNGTSAINAPSDHFTYNAPALPTVTGVSPSSGPTAGGTSVTVSGTNLTGASAVDFGTANPGTSISAVTATSLTVTSPAGTGTVDVTVTTPNGTSAINAPSDHFTYNAVTTPENTTTSLTVPALTYGSEGPPAAFTGTVAGPSASDGIPAGTVTVYYDYGVTGQTELCQATLSGGSGDSVNYSCSLASATQLPAGAYTNVVASYSGGSSSNSSFTYNASTSSPQGLTVSPASTSGNNLKIQLSSPGLLWGIWGLYEVKVTNQAASATTGTLTVTDALPSGLSYLGALAPGWNCSATGGNVTCTSTKAIAADGVDYLLLVVRVRAWPGTSITNTVNLTPVGTPASNYTSSVTTRVAGFFGWWFPEMFGWGFHGMYW